METLSGKYIFQIFLYSFSVLQFLKVYFLFVVTLMLSEFKPLNLFRRKNKKQQISGRLEAFPWNFKISIRHDKNRRGLHFHPAFLFLIHFPIFHQTSGYIRYSNVCLLLLSPPYGNAEACLLVSRNRPQWKWKWNKIQRCVICNSISFCWDACISWNSQYCVKLSPGEKWKFEFQNQSGRFKMLHSKEFSY